MSAHATHPFESLDDENLLALVERVQMSRGARSDNEGVAMRHVRDHFRRQERLELLLP